MLLECSYQQYVDLHLYVLDRSKLYTILSDSNDFEIHEHTISRYCYSIPDKYFLRTAIQTSQKVIMTMIIYLFFICHVFP